jgi:hypothetical protein
MAIYFWTKLELIPLHSFFFLSIFCKSKSLPCLGFLFLSGSERTHKVYFVLFLTPSLEVDMKLALRPNSVGLAVSGKKDRGAWHWTGWSSKGGVGGCVYASPWHTPTHLVLTSFVEPFHALTGEMGRRRSSPEGINDYSQFSIFFYFSLSHLSLFISLFL